MNIKKTNNQNFNGKLIKKSILNNVENATIKNFYQLVEMEKLTKINRIKIL